MKNVPLLLGGAGLLLLSRQKQQHASVKIVHEQGNADRLAKLQKAAAVRVARDKLPAFDAETSEMTIKDIREDIELREELKRYQNVGASQDEIDQFLQRYIKEKAEKFRRAKSHWPQWPEWMGITVVAGASAIFLGPQLMVAYGLTGSVGIIDIAFAAWQVSDLLGYAAEGSQTMAASLMADAWVGSRIKATTGMLKMLYYGIVEGGVVHELITNI